MSWVITTMLFTNSRSRNSTSIRATAFCVDTSRAEVISSLPEVGVRYEEQKLAGIPGIPPPLLTPPAGCRFRERCPLATARCQEQPPFAQVGDDHRVACWEVAA